MATLAVVLTSVIAVLDAITTTELTLFVLYLLPISLTVWCLSARTGIVLALCCTVIPFITDLQHGQGLTHPLIPLWNAGLRLFTFVVFGAFLAQLKVALDREKQLSRTDFLTGAANYRAFWECAGQELYRARRYRQPFTVTILDCDNFKTVNDTLGHQAGDDVLCAVVQVIQGHIRQTDTVARLGGDEFAVVMVGTDAVAARTSVARLHEILVDEMQRHSWPVTFSIGTVTFLTPPATLEEVHKRADELMYSVKHQGKNQLRYEVVQA